MDVKLAISRAGDRRIPHGGSDSPAPVAENAMTRKGGGMFADGYNQLATAQSFQRSLDSALRETGHFGERAQTRRNRFPFVLCSLTVKTKINQKSGRLAIMANEVAHKNVDDVIVDGTVSRKRMERISYLETMKP